MSAAIYDQTFSLQVTNGDTGWIGLGGTKQVAVDFDVQALGATSIQFFVDRLTADGATSQQIWASGALSLLGVKGVSLGPGLAVGEVLGSSTRIRWQIVAPITGVTFHVMLTTL